MAGGSLTAPLLTVSWPTGEFGAMGIEGAVSFALRRELASIDDPVQRQAVMDEAVAALYRKGSALSVASYFEIDDVIDPAATRETVAAVFRVAAAGGARHGDPSVPPSALDRHLELDPRYANRAAGQTGSAPRPSPFWLIRLLPVRFGTSGPVPKSGWLRHLSRGRAYRAQPASGGLA